MATAPPASNFDRDAFELTHVGVVVIGRNEAPRLRACLESIGPTLPTLIYVDSNSHDGSPEIAEQLGVEVARITHGPMSAARGRAAGIAALREQFPELQFVQFVDGDCQIDRAWLARGAEYLAANEDAAVVVGELREEHASQSLLSRLVDADWDLPVGDTDAIGGISMMRIDALEAVGGWREDLIAGEELDLSARLRAAGWRLHRLADPMTLHDIGVVSFSELWRRAVRSGFAYTQLALLHGKRYRRWLRRSIGSLFYGAALPIAILLASILWHPYATLAALLYPLLIARIAWHRIRRGDGALFATLYGCVVLAFKFASALGALRFFWLALRGRSARLMEYKSAARSPGAA